MQIKFKKKKKERTLPTCPVSSEMYLSKASLTD
jgi:hypothetical protein